MVSLHPTSIKEIPQLGLQFEPNPKIPNFLGILEKMIFIMDAIQFHQYPSVPFFIFGNFDQGFQLALFQPRNHLGDFPSIDFFLFGSILILGGGAGPESLLLPLKVVEEVVEFEAGVEGKEEGSNKNKAFLMASWAP